MAQFSMEIMRLTGSVLRGNQHPEGFDSFLFTVVMLSEFERISAQVIAELDREIAFNKARMLEIAINMFLDQGT